MENAAIFKPTKLYCLKLNRTEQSFLTILLEIATQLNSYLMDATNTGIWFTDANAVPVVDKKPKLIFTHTHHTYTHTHHKQTTHTHTHHIHKHTHHTHTHKHTPHTHTHHTHTHTTYTHTHTRIHIGLAHANSGLWEQQNDVSCCPVGSIRCVKRSLRKMAPYVFNVSALFFVYPSTCVYHYIK